MCGGILDFLFLVVSPVRASQLWKNHNSCIYSIYYLLVFKPLVASISFCVKRMIANMLPTFLCDSESNVAWAHPSLTYLMAGFWWRPVAQIEKFPVAKWNVWLGLQSRKIGDCSILIPNSISDKVDFWPIHWALLVDISAARTYRMKEWILMNAKDVHRLFFFKLLLLCRWGKRGERRRPLDPLGLRNPSPYSEYSPVKFRKRYQSHFEALGLHLFVRDAERCSDDCANSSNPTYSRSSHKTHTRTHAHTHHAQSICHFPPASVFQASSAVESELWHSKVLIEEAVAALSAAESYK